MPSPSSASPFFQDDLPSRFIALALALDRLLPGFVDANFGPEEWKDAVRRRPDPQPHQLAREAEALLGDLEADRTLDEDRRSALAAQPRSAHTLARKLGGEAMSFSEEVDGLYGHSASWTPESVFVEAHQQLDEILPGMGALAERVSSFQRTVAVSPDRLRIVLSVILGRLQSEATRLFALPPTEKVEVAFVSGQPWSAYNAYLGRYRSRMEIGADWPHELPGLADLVAHEAYPGHHTEHCVKEATLIEERGWEDFRLVLLNSPLSVVSEGLATSALDVLFIEGEWKEWHRQEVFPAAGIPLLDAEAGWVCFRSKATLLRTVGNAATLLLDQRLPEQEALAYLRRYRLVDEASAERSLRFILNPLVRGYVFNYWVGRDRMAPLLKERNSAPRAFETLLRAPSAAARILAGQVDSGWPWPT